MCVRNANNKIDLRYKIIEKKERNVHQREVKWLKNVHRQSNSRKIVN